LDITYQYQENELQELIDKTAAGQLDIAVAALTINAQREEIVDFTHTYFSTGLGIAARTQSQGFLGLLSNLFSLQFFQAVGGLAITLLLFGLLVWLFERKRNPDQFGGKLWKGIGSGFWWSAVTMTTVGYGDKAPVTPGGRAVALIWMFMALIVISSFTAAIASALTVNQLEAVIDSPDDLYKAKVATVENSSSASFLTSRDIGYREFGSVEEALEQLYAGKVDAVVYDIPIMQYLLKQEDTDKVEILPQAFKKLFYGFALPQDSELREAIDIKILEITTRSEWQKTLQDYLGSE
jgi:ABC-type amino acid transport substrate-binding protein